MNNGNRRPDLLQSDLIKNKYHIFSFDNAKIDGFYEKDLLEIITKTTNLIKQIKIHIGEAYTVRAFFALCEPVDDIVNYQSGFLDVKIVLEENDTYLGEVLTVLPPVFVLQKGSRIKLHKSSILYKPDYSPKKNSIK